MRLLLDTHVLLWSVGADPKLKPALRDAIEAAEEVFVSAVSIWEIAIKSALGKLVVAGDIESRALDAGCQPLPVTWAHGRDAGRLPLHHHDPFDRLLIAQARVEGLTLVSADRLFSHYDVSLL
jgi:PIN domain nuclease of toxin-antitoxin system